MNTTSLSPTSRMLGYAGLIPFLLPVVLVASGSTYGPVSIQMAGGYALAIICFLCGSWWGMGQSSGCRATLLLSNAFLLLALSLYLFVQQWWLLAAAGLLTGAWLCEQSRTLFPTFPQGYRLMRSLLTLVAASSMGLLQLSA
jgi:hypothetical protein